MVWKVLSRAAKLCISRFGADMMVVDNGRADCWDRFSKETHFSSFKVNKARERKACARAAELSATPAPRTNRRSLGEPGDESSVFVVELHLDVEFSIDHC